VEQIRCCTIEWVRGDRGFEMREVPGTEFILPAELVLIAMGFVHVAHSGLVEELGLELDNHGNVAVQRWMTNQPGVFAAGDTVKGASLVVHAINQGRLMAAAVDEWLRG
jgi:glutamate synthase (NADPH/NADH) small chain